jgi:predicted alternative tryptophan synthase beta-subunit
MSTLLTALSTVAAPPAVLAAGLLYAGTVSCIAMLAARGRTAQIRRDARRTLALLLLRRPKK